MNESAELGKNNSDIGNDSIWKTTQTTYATHGAATTLISTLALLINVLAFISMTRNHGKPLSAFRMALANLCVADLIVCLIRVISSLFWLFGAQLTSGSTVCTVIRLGTMFGVNASSCIVTLIGMDRAFAVSQPMTVLSVSRRRITLLLLLAWTLSLISCLPLPFVHEPVENDARLAIRGVHLCRTAVGDKPTTELLYFSLIYIFFFVLPLIVMVVSYTVIGCIIRQRVHAKLSETIKNEGVANHPIRSYRHDSTISITRNSVPPMLPSNKAASANCMENAPMRRTNSLVEDRLIVRERPMLRISSDCNMPGSASPPPAAAARRYVQKLHLVTTCDFVGRRISREAVPNRKSRCSFSQGIDAHFKKAGQNSMKLCFIIVIAFFVCWTPYYTLYMVAVVRNFSNRSATFRLPSNFLIIGYWLYLLTCLNPLINPIIYGNFRRQYLPSISVCFRRVFTHSRRRRESFI